MTDQEKEEVPFIREKIKEKPVNKRKLLKQGSFTVVFAVLFGLIACFVFTLMQPYMKSWLYPEKEPEIQIPADELSATEEESEEEPQETEEKQEVQETVVTKELELSDYQQLQNKIYAIGKKANRSVVTVTGVSSDTDWYNNAYESSGQASGIIIGDNGPELLILTEHKAVAEAETISVTFINDVTVTARLKNYDGNTGLAMLAVQMDEVEQETRDAISYAVLGNSRAVSQGNIAIAIGSPLGTNYSIGTGNITSTGNVIQTLDYNYTVFTTDIVGSRSSSGVLLNLDGEVIGLVMQDYSGNGEENTLTAISISDLKKIIEKLSNGRDVAYLGLKVATVTDQIADEYDLPKGIFIKEVAMDSPALYAGLQTGDIVIEVNGQKVHTVEEYEEQVLQVQPGDTVSVAVDRQGMQDYVRMDYEVTAGKLQ